MTVGFKKLVHEIPGGGDITSICPQMVPAVTDGQTDRQTSPPIPKSRCCIVERDKNRQVLNLELGIGLHAIQSR